MYFRLVCVAICVADWISQKTASPENIIVIFMTFMFALSAEAKIKSGI